MARAGVQIKVDRAKQHLGNLRQAIARFKSRYPYSAVHNGEVEGNFAHYVVSGHPTPDGWGAVIGDVVHNARSALDNAWWQINAGRQRKMYFPMLKLPTPKNDKTRLKVKEHARYDKAFNVLSAINPYSANGPMWMLAELDNLDKHNGLLLVGNRLGRSVISVEGAPTITIEADLLDTLEDGAIIALHGIPLDADGRVTEKDQKIDLPYEIAFRETEITGGKGVLDTLNRLTGVVNEIVSALVAEGVVF